MIITPEKLAEAGSEDAHQAALILWAKQTARIAGYEGLNDLFAIPNGGSRDKREAMKFKMTGVKAGVFDLFLPVPVTPYCGMFIEMKKPNTGRVSDEQEAFGQRMRARGYYCVVCWHWEDARNEICDYLASVVQGA